MKFIKIILTTIVLLLFLNCVQETHSKTITLKLDMRQVENINNVGARGGNAPLSWNKTFQLTDTNKDSIYEGKIELKSASFDIEFKFVNNTDEFELQDQNNRSIRFEYKPETIIYEAVFNNPDKHITKTK
ncbi:hypothetical protein BFR04_11775 [Gaetbulibacter sp. 4G1]|nr:hypothetical protein [Gaetbulibacter sp. 4G1]PIA81978.1 hypothetical protein BFR04_11775 [Gaetbulibacter sp. 4G1]